MTRRLITLDPPWGTDRGGGKITRGANKHYDLVAAGDEWKVVVLSEAFDPDERGCLVWCWYTTLSRRLVPTLFSRLGIRDTGAEMIWVKVKRSVSGFAIRKGLGQYVHMGHEYARLGVIGEVSTPVPYRPPSVILADRGEHSAKPDEAYIEWLKMAQGVWPDEEISALAMFERTARPGYDVWGDEAPE